MPIFLIFPLRYFLIFDISEGPYVIVTGTLRDIAAELAAVLNTRILVTNSEDSEYRLKSYYVKEINYDDNSSSQACFVAILTHNDATAVEPKNVNQKALLPSTHASFFSCHLTYNQLPEYPIV